MFDYKRIKIKLLVVGFIATALLIGIVKELMRIML